MSKPSRKILMLHGYTQSASIFSKRVAAMRKACPKDIDFVFVDAPTILTPTDIAATFGTPAEEDKSSSLASLGAAEASADAADPALLPRAWWKATPQETESKELTDSLATLRDILKAETYEGVLGFSQGAAMAAVLTALLERPERYPEFLVDGKPPHPPFKFCVSVAGFLPRGDLPAAIFESGYSTPTLHVLGKNDIVVTEERARTLLELSLVKRVVEHDGGHFVPSKGPWRKFFAEYFKQPDQLNLVPAPGVGAPASGTATPVESSIVAPVPTDAAERSEPVAP
ncbi:hypothetical protein PUNSTDRAFT_54011 [Punctularia strigosozonata HHB-11173 SS5]|uniref:uncharacterized protein n=1 Tax=Punctularia strigosozonata (strain HHB-11173) TaxID=741275 RepID=UPI0004417E3B|nr:uncharacterized protein PUNSTDRAFT_54011 [Punctularia strigosozonata HHB-11173 SS5]EIN06596.1 hypothetical protein PUNSTDRAFT_54011 [Punctularia strigosozonata HHB-11173 SS5]